VLRKSAGEKKEEAKKRGTVQDQSFDPRHLRGEQGKVHSTNEKRQAERRGLLKGR